MGKLIYFDNSATTKLDERVLNKMIPYLTENYGNLSSIYYLGRKNKRVIEEARNIVAYNINSLSKEIYFTSCGSESDNLAVKGIAYANKNKGKHIITSKIEHPAILNTCKTLEKQGYEITYLNVDNKGFINLKELEETIRQDTILVSIMFANNEIGTIEPIEEIGKIARKHNIFFHTDCVQAMGNIRIDVKKMNIDLLSMSAHKFYGPKGVGALYVRDGIEFNCIQNGGHQEKGKRAGTENVAGIVGLAEALNLSYREYKLNNYRIINLRNYFIDRLYNINKNIKINGDLENRLPGNVNVSFVDFDAEQILFKLDEYNICASAGSACSTGSSSPSHVLTSIGLTKEEINRNVEIFIRKT